MTSTPARRAGRPPQIDRADIVAAALAVIDEAGPEALTMRRLGAELGVAAMSLYRHLPNRDAVLAAVVDHLAAETASHLDLGPAAEPAEPWPATARAFAAGYRAMLLRHPRAVPLLATHPVSADTGLSLFAPVLDRFTAAGIDHDDALTVIQSVGVFTLGHALAQVGTPPGADPAAHPGAGADYYDRWYAAGLTALLEGFRRRLDP